MLLYHETLGDLACTFPRDGYLEAAFTGLFNCGILFVSCILWHQSHLKLILGSKALSIVLQVVH